MRTIDDIVRQEVLCCLSSLVHTLAQGYGRGFTGAGDLAELSEQASEICYPLQDWESAAIDAGWEPFRDEYGAKCYLDSTDGQTWAAASWQELCEDHDIEPHEREIFEHWAVTEWFAEKLEAKGERVDRDFAGLCVWGRTCNEQGIACDLVVQEIHADLLAPNEE
jgi:hypothetical protein